MYKLILLFSLVAVAVGQYRSDPSTAAILSETRFQSGDGSFGSAYTQEDGVQFKEETDSDGNRKGSYSYVDPEGKKITLHYTAGKDGFRVSGDHLPRAPVAPPAQAPRQQYQPQQQYNPQPQYNPQQYQPQQQYNPQQYQQPAQQNNGQFSYSLNPQQPAQQYNSYTDPAFNTIQHTTTPAPSRFFPPGKLALSRTQDGYHYTFST